MKKIILLLMVCVALAGCGSKQNKTQNQDQPKENKGVWESIKDAMTKSISLRCEYTDVDGTTSINYIKGKMIRTESAIEKGGSVKAYGIFKDDKVYIWTDNSKDGFVFDMSKLGDDAKMGETDIKSTDDIISELEKNKQNCRTETVPDSFFDLPKDVTFTDWSSFIPQ